MRRETDNDSDGTGLLRSLGALASVPRMATRAWYQQHIRDEHSGRSRSDLEEMFSLFNRFAAPAAAFIDAARVRDDIGALRAVIDDVNRYTTTVIAHRDAAIARGATPGIAITWRQLDEALDTIGTMHVKYYSLCQPGESLGALTPLTPPMWAQIFQTAWTPAGFKIPDPWSNDPPRLHPI